MPCRRSTVSYSIFDWQECWRTGTARSRPAAAVRRSSSAVQVSIRSGASMVRIRPPARPSKVRQKRIASSRPRSPRSSSK